MNFKNQSIELEFRAMLDSYYNLADTAFTSMIGTLANEGWEYYYGARPVAPIEGSSKYVDRSVFETVNGTVQDLLSVFVSGEEYACVKTPSGDVGATQYINRTLIRRNNGYRELSSVFKESCVVRNSFLKFYWEDQIDTVDEDFEDMSKDEIEAYLEQLNQVETRNAEVISAVEDEYGLFSGSIAYLEDRSGVQIEYCPIEEVIVDPHARSIKESSYLCHRTYKTREELEDMGFSKDLLAQVGAGDQRVYFYSYEYTRNAGRMSQFDNNQQDLRDGNAKITLLEHYIRTSMLSDDGRVKLYQVFTAGNNIILEINEVDRIPFATATPFPIPGAIYGESVVDITKDIQDIKTAIMRGYIDNIHNANHASVIALSGQYTKRDLIDNRPRRIVEVQTPNAITPFPYNPLPAGIDNLLEHVEQAKEMRSGVSRLGSGLNADVFKNDNAFATVNQAMTAAQNRLRMVARNIAETFMKELVEGIYHLARQHDKRPFMVESFMGVQPVVPKKQWPEEMEVIIEVAIGQAERLNYANSLIQAFQLLSQSPMLQGTAFGMQNAHYLAYNAMKYMGIRDLPLALTPMSQVQPPQPDPMMQKAKELELAELEAKVMEKQAKAQETQAKTQEAQAKLQLDTQRLMFEQQVAADEFKLKVQDYTSKGQREADRTVNERYENQVKTLREQLDAQMKTSEIVAQQEEAADKIFIEQQKLRLEEEKLRLEAFALQLKAQEMQMTAQMETERMAQTDKQIELQSKKQILDHDEKREDRNARIQQALADQQLKSQSNENKNNDKKEEKNVAKPE